VGRRGVKEYRAPEALILIAADRDHKALVCPSCGSTAVDRNPPRSSKADEHPSARVTLHCTACGRSAVYIDRGAGASQISEAPWSR
jgi:transposase-like protein